MTLILTCLEHEHIVQVADRRLTRLDGSLYDDDTNKAVFYCGRVAVAYTGLAVMEGKPTAEWIGSCMKDEADVQPAMKRVAERAEHCLKRYNIPDKRFAVVATGWATLQGKQPLRPFICVASNFLSDSWEWKASADERMTVKVQFLDEKCTHLIFAAGQSLSKKEKDHLDRLVRRAVKHGAKTMTLVRILGGMVRAVASGTDARAQRVGKGIIIHLLSRKALMEGRRQIVTPLKTDTHSFLYVSREGRTDSFEGPIIACNGALLAEFKFGKTPPQ